LVQRFENYWRVLRQCGEKPKTIFMALVIGLAR
jgi:hypothetical protein